MTVATAENTILVADEAWVALALLHREHPERDSFAAREINQRVKEECIAGEVRPGVAVHVSHHNVANTAPTSGAYRMFYRLPGGTYRLYRQGDDFHPDRKGKPTPSRVKLPERFHYLLDWYEQEYCRSARTPEDDPVLAMLGVGKEIWHEEDGDAFLARLRSGW